MCRERVAIVLLASLDSTVGLCASMLAAEIDGARVGRCIVLDGIADPPSIADRAGGASVILLEPFEGGGSPVAENVEPYMGDDIVRVLWPAMTGTTSLKAMSEALATLLSRTVKAVRLPVTGPSACRREILSFIEHLCDQPGQDVIYPVDKPVPR